MAFGIAGWRKKQNCSLHQCFYINVVPLWNSLFMVISHAQRAEAALTQMLASVSDCSAADLRRGLEMSKAIGSKLAAYQSRAAAALAALQRHGDGGAGVLRHATGVSRRQAESHARTARVLEDMPMVREALEDGRVTFANAARLAQAAEGTGSGAVEADASLLSNAESMTDDQFAREARRWTASRQPDDGETDYQRRRARRWLRLWDGDDGMTQLRGELDPVTGERIRNRLESEARRLRRDAARGESGGGGEGKPSFVQAMADSLDSLTAIGSSVGGFAAEGGSGNRRGRDASRADTSSPADNTGNRRNSDRSRAKSNSTADNTGNRRGGDASRADTSSAADHTANRGIGDGNGSHADGDSNVNRAASSGSDGTGDADPASNPTSTNSDGSLRDRPHARGGGPNIRSSDDAGYTDNGGDDSAGHAEDCRGASTPAREANPDNRDGDDAARASGALGTNSSRGNGVGGDSRDTRGRRSSGSGDSDCSCGRRKARVQPIADIAVVSHVDSATGDLVSQLATGEPLPPSVLEMLACNAAIRGVLYDTAGTPLWRGTTKRTATAAQLKALIARDGGCVGCGCHPALCQAHHIRPASQGGPTTISNMVLLCWHCHQKVHHNQWTVARRHGRFEVLPPVRTRWGPARAP